MGHSFAAIKEPPLLPPLPLLLKSPENSTRIKYVPVHEILDEVSPEALYGNLSEDNLKIPQILAIAVPP